MFECTANQTEMLGIGEQDYIVHRNERTTILDVYNFTDHEYNSNKAPETVVAGVFNQWHNMYCAFAHAPLEYDVYVRMRYDIKFDRQIHFENYEMRDDVIYITSGNDYRDGINDQFAFGSYNVMKVYYSIIHNHSIFWNQGKYFHPETYVKLNLEHHGIRIERIPQTNYIVRP